MPHYYAQIDAAGVAYAITQAAGPIQQADMIPLASFDTSVLGKRWTGSAWVAA